MGQKSGQSNGDEEYELQLEGNNDDRIADGNRKCRTGTQVDQMMASPSNRTRNHIEGGHGAVLGQHEVPTDISELVATTI